MILVISQKSPGCLQPGFLQSASPAFRHKQVEMSHPIDEISYFRFPTSPAWRIRLIRRGFCECRS